MESPKGYLLMAGVELFFQSLCGPAFLLPTWRALCTDYRWLLLHSCSQRQHWLPWGLRATQGHGQALARQDLGPGCHFGYSGGSSWMGKVENASGRDGFLKGPGVGGGLQRDYKAGRGSLTA